MSRTLSKGWAEFELGDHVYIAGRIGWRGLKAEEYKPVGPILLSVPNLNHGDEVDFGKVYHITQARYDESPEIQLEVGDTLLVKDGAGIGKLGFLADLPSPATINSSLLVVRPANELLENKYLFYYLKGPKFQQIALERISGSATPHLFQKDIKKLQVLAPPRNEQRRIVAKLETLLCKVDASQQRLAKIPVLLKRFRQSVLAAACSGRLTADWREVNPHARASDSLRQRATTNEDNGDLPTSWIACRVGDVMKLKNGFAFKSTDYIDTGVPLVRISNIQDGKVSLDESAKLPPEKANWDFAVEKGDLLVAMSGATTGKFGIYFGDEKCLQNQRVGNIKILDANEVLPGFRNIALRALKRRIEEDAYGGAQPNISPTKIESLPFGCPPLPEQQEIVRRVEGLFALADQLELRLAKARGHVDALTPSLLARAFAGKLVPQDPRDEPAEKLLERIKSNHESKSRRDTRK